MLPKSGTRSDWLKKLMSYLKWKDLHVISSEALFTRQLDPLYSKIDHEAPPTCNQPGWVALLAKCKHQLHAITTSTRCSRVPTLECRVEQASILTHQYDRSWTPLHSVGLPQLLHALLNTYDQHLCNGEDLDPSIRACRFTLWSACAGSRSSLPWSRDHCRLSGDPMLQFLRATAYCPGHQ
jgi:hypothetical protein